MTQIETSADETLQKIGRAAKRRHKSGGFSIEILYPGMAQGSSDSGIGTIGRIDDANVAPGTLVAMHPHRDDEILTYLRAGKVMHKDTVGQIEWISPTRLMLMGAGRVFQHEELVDPAGEPLRALQMFLRPRIGGLEPEVQFHIFETSASDGAWRRVAGPEADAPLRVRSSSWVDDGRFEKGAVIALPQPAIDRPTRLLYVFSGSVSLSGVELSARESAILGADGYELKMLDDSELVVLTTDVSAPVFTGGMFSGNVVPPR